ncbi:MAG: type II toxin-antitoxin system RelE/ParE family toxin [Chloroflexota bacterium]
MYQCKIGSLPRRQIKAISSDYIKREIYAIIDMLVDDPYPPGSQLEDELQHRYRFRVNGYRIIYMVNEQDKVIRILTVRPRNQKTYLNVP